MAKKSRFTLSAEEVEALETDTDEASESARVAAERLRKALPDASAADLRRLARVATRAAREFADLAVVAHRNADAIGRAAALEPAVSP